MEREWTDGLDWLANASREELMSIRTVGAKTADSIVSFFQQEANQGIVDRLRKAGVTGRCEMEARGMMDKEELAEAERSRERIQAGHPDMRQETDESKLKGRELTKIGKKEVKQAMAENKKNQKAVEAEKATTAKAKTPDQSKDKAPVAPAGKKAIWHKPYSYTNKAGTVIIIRGHWELANMPKEKPKVETKAEEKE